MKNIIYKELTNLINIDNEKDFIQFEIIHQKKKYYIDVNVEILENYEYDIIESTREHPASSKTDIKLICKISVFNENIKKIQFNENLDKDLSEYFSNY